SGGVSQYQIVGVVLSYTDTSVDCQATYYYRVSAINEAGEGSPSPDVSAVSYCLPAAPQNLVATVQTSQIKLSWQTPASNGGSPITGYKIYRSISSNRESLLAAIDVAASYTDNSVTSGVTYYYEITAINAAGESEFSIEVNSTPIALEFTISAPQSGSF